MIELIVFAPFQGGLRSLALREECLLCPAEFFPDIPAQNFLIHYELLSRAVNVIGLYQYFCRNTKAGI
jgi:hypothetical protein